LAITSSRTWMPGFLPQQIKIFTTEDTKEHEGIQNGFPSCP
jgi:hypothetical protein